MRCLLSVFTLLYLAAPSAEAQIIAIFFEEEKDARKHREYLVEWQGEQCVVGEPKKGIVFQNGVIQYQGNGRNELFVADPDDPGEPAYYVRDGERHATSRRNRIAINGKDIREIKIMMRAETLAGLAKEYRLRMAQIEEYREARDQFEEGTKDWTTHHARLVSAMETLRRWLSSTAFPGALKKFDREIEDEEDEAEGHFRARATAALESIRRVDPPEALVAASEEHFGGADDFRTQESMHIRVHYCQEFTDEQVREMLTVGEEVIEGFRNQFIDPWLAEDYPDHVPDRVFQEFLFVPDTDEAFMTYSRELWNVDWSRRREERLKSTGGNLIGGGNFRNYWRNDDVDLPGIVCHRLGHSLAALHYGGGKVRFLPQDWISEGLGYHLSFEHLGRNTTTCKAFHDPEQEGYVRRELEKKQEGEKSIGIGRRDTYNEIALQFGRPIDQLALRDLYEMDDADLAKSWSFFDYVLRKEGLAGQRWLQAAGKNAHDKNGFIALWREAAASILGVEPRQAFSDVEERWRAFASGEQDTSDSGRR